MVFYIKLAKILGKGKIKYSYEQEMSEKEVIGFLMTQILNGHSVLNPRVVDGYLLGNNGEVITSNKREAEKYELLSRLLELYKEST